jgi:tol-pal system protein YbgF
MLRAIAFAIAVALAGAAAPARAGLFDDEEARRQIANLQRLVDAQQKRLEGIETEVRDRRALLDLATQIEQLRGDLAKMRGQLELLANQAENADKRQKDLYVDIDARLRKLEPQKEKEAAGAEKPAAGPAEPAAAETKAYEAALNQFKLANYPLAISAFIGFLVTYPSSPLAPSAQYWIGNAHYAQRDYKNTIAAQQKVIANWPDNPKAADAMLNMASAQAESGDARGARRTLEALVAKYPASPAAASAKQRLAQPAAKR